MRDVTATFCRRETDTGISTHTSHAGRDLLEENLRLLFLISTHTSHAGRDQNVNAHHIKANISTHTSHAGRDHHKVQLTVFHKISTHTSHAGRDVLNLSNVSVVVDFYSHVPCGT